jgi:hypothetical protein
VYSFDTSKPRKLSFRVALSGNFANKWIPGVEGEPPLLVKGHVVLALDQRSVDALLAQRKNIDIEQIILDALKDPLSEARSSREDLKAYSEKVLPALRGKLPAGIENAIQSLEIEEVTKDSGSAVSSIETVATKLETLKRLPLGVFLSYFWLTGIVAVIFILTYALIPELFIILSGVIVFIPLAIANACGGGLGSGFDFDGPDINIDF